jgi:outer membrane usher protein
VLLNGEDTRMITVADIDGATLRMAAADLRELRIAVDPALPADATVDLATVPGLKYEVDEVAQLLRLTITDAGRTAFEVPIASRVPLDPTRITPATGFLANYDIYTASAGGRDNRAYTSGSLATRFMSPYGAVENTGFFNTDPITTDGKRFVRLDSTWRYVDAAAIRGYAVGDIVSGGPGWAGNYRLGGVQVQSAFQRRPDIVTTALPQFGGSAAVPSSVELYINNTRLYSGQVPSGPFTLNSLPTMSGGDVRIVTRDALGRETTITSAYYYSPDLLRQGILQYSAEAGWLRYGYGQRSFDYGDMAATGSARWGWTDDTSLEGHAESTRGFVNLGAGVVQRLGSIGALNLSASQSSFEGASGSRVAVQGNFLTHGVSAYAGTERRNGSYFDLGRVSLVRNPDVDLSSPDVYTQLLTSTLSARAIDRAGIGFQLPFDPRTNLNLGYTSVTPGNAANQGYRLVNLSASRSLWRGASLMLSGYRDLDRRTSTVYVGLSMSLDNNVNGMASMQRSNGQTTRDLQASGFSNGGGRQEGMGWSVLAREGETSASAYRQANVNFRTAPVWLSASAQQQNGQGRVTGQASGSLLLLDGEVRAANRIGEAFVLVKNAGPEAGIRQDSVVIGTARSDGTAFLPDVQAFRPTKVSLDPTQTPIGWQMPETEKTVVAGYQNGVVVDFAARRVRSAVLKLVDAAGKPIPAGYVVRLANGRQGMVGYEGEAYLENVDESNNTGRIDRGIDGVCTFGFNHPGGETVQPVLGPIKCEVPR